MSFTVKATTSNNFDSVVLKVYVVTDGTESGGADAVGGGFRAPTWTLTPSASGSLIVEGAFTADPGAAAIAPNASNTTDNDGTSTGNCPWWFGHWTGAVTGGTPITTLGGTNVSNWQAWTSFEVEASGGAPAIDVSTPSPATGNPSATTAAFNPPPGAVLVALILSNNTAAPAPSVSDTSGLGLTWTQRGSTYFSGYVGTSAVFTTTIPGAPAASPASLLMSFP